MTDPRASYGTPAHPASPRTPTAVDAVAERYAERLAALSPEFALYSGLPGRLGALDDYSPAGFSALADLRAQTLAALDTAAPVDDVDRVTIAAMRERFGVEDELHEAGEDLRALNNIASPIQTIRDTFDNHPMATAGDWESFASALRAVPGALAGHRESLRVAAARGLTPAARQVRACIKQAQDQAGKASSSFTALIEGARLADGGALPAALTTDLRAAAREARAAYAEAAHWLATDISPLATGDDAVDRERYERFSREFLGTRIDLDETYEWGRERLAAIDAEQQDIAASLYGPGTTVAEALERLGADASRQVRGTEALRAWMQETSDAAISALDGTQFDIPAPLRALECRIAPSSTGGIYYTAPSDDFSRPGRMWWSVPAGTEDFATWQERTTVFHEGAPGHHLQIGMQTLLRDELNSWRRHGCWVSGHGEGWALYAERLMADLGFQEDPADRMGMLDSQRLRAARVVLDIGVHLRKERPAELAALPGVGEGHWDAGSAWAFLRANAAMGESFLRFELDRYLGWPGQAPSYAVGQRLWEEARDASLAAARAAGADDSLKAFHARALRLGSVGLDVMREALAA
ncbi:DUF885 domain-containing protein [Actinomyces gaoshouyii]|uniref:DUF885 domain-containing protein n=1 Tax=Actinomyces gaoshouyii TaxID=1960083 RepID=A0A8H9LKH8_9ACTO|nr:DUF885 domain-containing protein [Actinomyces gaoshouyii]GGO94748.1 hypothetical protein GCM10011612_00910 [Actinomyces gaoshouyii]